VPFLKDIPLLGAAFRNSESGDKRTEIIVLLSARIVRSDDASGASFAEMEKAMTEIERRGLLATNKP
jgi:general secretion pathway protein D